MCTRECMYGIPVLIGYFLHARNLFYNCSNLFGQIQIFLSGESKYLPVGWFRITFVGQLTRSERFTPIRCRHLSLSSYNLKQKIYSSQDSKSSVSITNFCSPLILFFWLLEQVFFTSQKSCSVKFVIVNLRYFLFQLPNQSLGVWPVDYYRVEHRSLIFWLIKY